MRSGTRRSEREFVTERVPVPRRSKTEVDGIRRRSGPAFVAGIRKMCFVFFSCSRLRVSSLVVSSAFYTLRSLVLTRFCRFGATVLPLLKLQEVYFFRFASWTIGEVRSRVISFLFRDIGGVTSFSKAKASSEKWRICYSCWRSSLLGAHSLLFFPPFFPPSLQILIPLWHRLHRELHQFSSSNCDLSLQKQKKRKKKVLFFCWWPWKRTFSVLCGGSVHGEIVWWCFVDERLEEERFEAAVDTWVAVSSSRLMSFCIMLCEARGNLVMARVA